MTSRTRWLAAGIVAGFIASSSAQAADLAEQRELVNDGTVTVLGGSLTGTYSSMIADMSSVFDDGYKLRVLPVIGKGSIRGIEDLLLLRGIDVALVQSDVLDFITQHDIYPNIHNLVRYITYLFNEEVHLVARRGINTIQDLEGKKVSFGPASSGGFMTASIVFEAAGINVEALELSHEEGLDQLKSGQIDAMVRLAGAPVRFLQEIPWEDQLHIVPLPSIPGSYIDTEVTSEQYPGLVPAGESVKTVAVGAVMAAYNWPEGHPRRVKVQRLVDAMSSRIDELRSGDYHEKWKQVDLDKDLPGWERWDEQGPNS